MYTDIVKHKIYILVLFIMYQHKISAALHKNSKDFMSDDKESAAKKQKQHIQK